MKKVINIIDCLERTPGILNNLLEFIPSELFRKRRKNDKWCIHEQICHLAEAQDILKARFRQFEEESQPYIRSYEPPEDRSSKYYMDLNMKAELERFREIRREMVTMLKGFDQTYWAKTGKHEIFSPYSSQLLLIHALNVDYAHLFSIEQLGLTRSEYENNIITIP